MSALLTFLALFAVVIFQVTVSPLFPFSIAQFDIPLVFVAWTTLFRGPKTAMWVVPVAAILLGMLTFRSPALFLLALLPVVPMIAISGVSYTNFLLGNYWRSLLVVMVAGAWARTLFALAAIAQGADPAFGTLVGSIIIPGIFLDGTLLTLAFAPSRLIGLDVANMALTRGGYTAYERS